MASGALDVLESARVCASLEEALAGTTYSLALSARERELSHSVLDARAAARELLSAARRDEVAIVFGNETAGLSNKDIMRCSALARIPADPQYSSLNLAQAVQVIAYELRMAALDPPAVSAKTGQATHEEIEKLREHVAETLDELLPDHEQNDDAYRLAVSVLQNLKAGAIWMPLTYFDLWVTRLTGLLPALDEWKLKPVAGLLLGMQQVRTAREWFETLFFMTDGRGVKYSALKFRNRDLPQRISAVAESPPWFASMRAAQTQADQNPTRPPAKNETDPWVD